MNLTYWNKWQMLAAIAADGELSVTGKLVAIRLLDHFNLETGQCNPSYNGIAKALGFTRKRAIVGVQDLESRGWITVQRMTLSDATGSRGFERNTFCPAFVRIGISYAPSVENDTTPRAENDTTPSVENSPTPSVENDTLTIQDKPSNSNTPGGGEGLGDRLADEGPSSLFGEPARAVAKKPPLDTDGPWQVFRSIYVRKGSNFTLARDLYNRAVKAGHDPHRINAGAREYMAFCAAEKRDNSKIKCAESFLAVGKDHWLVDYGPSSQRAAPSIPQLTGQQWAAFVREFRNGGTWPKGLGPAPGAPGCGVPSEALRSASSHAQAAA